MTFSGSYATQDVQFLLKPLPMQQFVDVESKEALIQTGRKHYSEMLSPESLPSEQYMRVFRDACELNRRQMARDCLVLAGIIAQSRQDEITIVSLARAGTPVGVIIKHLLDQVFHRTCAHYSISIIRDRGIDEVALQYILDRGHTPQSIVFIDGWTGKGVISRELAHWVSQFNTKHGLAIDGGLYVLSDLAGTSACASSGIDYLIPSSILNATVSGLVSRSILNEQIGVGDFHGCVFYEQFHAHDQSRQFAADIVNEALDLVRQDGMPTAQRLNRAEAEAISKQYMHQAMQKYGVTDVNLIKPGVGEATRVLLRRVPRLLILRDPGAADVAHLKVLAAEKNVRIVVQEDIPYQAVSLIRSAVDG